MFVLPCTATITENWRAPPFVIIGGWMHLALFAVGFLLVASPGTLVVTLNAQDQVPERMRAWSTALGVECSHCHVVGSWGTPARPAFEFAQRMSRMVSALNAGP